MPSIDLPEPLLVNELPNDIFQAAPPPKEGEEDERKPYRLTDLIRWLINNDHAYNLDGPGLRAGMRIESACYAADESGKLELLPEDVKKLSERLEAPQARIQTRAGVEFIALGYPVVPPRKLAPWLELVKSAVPKP